MEFALTAHGSTKPASQGLSVVLFGAPLRNGREKERVFGSKGFLLVETKDPKPKGPALDLHFTEVKEPDLGPRVKVNPSLPPRIRDQPVPGPPTSTCHDKRFPSPLESFIAMAVATEKKKGLSES
jgi:hypothetical protein